MHMIIILSIGQSYDRGHFLNMLIKCKRVFLFLKSTGVEPIIKLYDCSDNKGYSTDLRNIKLYPVYNRPIS